MSTPCDAYEMEMLNAIETLKSSGTSSARSPLRTFVDSVNVSCESRGLPCGRRGVRYHQSAGARLVSVVRSK